MIVRVPASVPTRSRTVVSGNFVMTVAVASEKSPSTFAQTTQALSRIDASLREANTDRKSILSAIVYLADMTKKEEMNRAWDNWVDRDNPPLRACLGATLEGDDLVEIIVTAAKV